MAKGLVVEWGLPDGITEMQPGSVKGHLMELPRCSSTASRVS